MVSRRELFGLCLLVVICLAAGMIGGAVTTPKIASWYAGLAKPAWTPPNWIFGPVWTILYLCMAISAWLVWRKDVGSTPKAPLVLFGIQLALNVLWSCLFFGLQSPRLAFFELVLLWLAITATTAMFWRRSIVAGVLLLPYLLWVTFAGALNFAVWRLNG
jgi:translocator protein